MVTSGYSWLFLVTESYTWLHSEIHGIFAYLYANGYIWYDMFTLGDHGNNMVTYGNSWLVMIIHFNIW